jgi:hypothetical protein
MSKKKSQQRAGRAVGKASLRGVVAATILLSLSGLAIGARQAWYAPLKARVVPMLPAAGATASQDVETVSVVLGPEGFAPQSIERATGAFRLTVENQSGVAELNLQLKRNGGGQEGQWTVTPGAQSWSEVLDLSTGVYVLTEANNPAWLYEIRVQ